MLAFVFDRNVSLTDIDGLESSAIGGQLMASASTESPFTQSRRTDDSTVAGKVLDPHTLPVLSAIKLSYGSISEGRFCLGRKGRNGSYLAPSSKLMIKHSLLIGTM